MHEGRVKKVLGDTDSVLSLAVNPTLSYYVTTHVLGVSLCLMVDTGAAVSLLRKDKWQLLGGADKYKLEQWTGSQLVGVEGSPVPVYGATCAKVQMGEGDLCVSIDFLVVESKGGVADWDRFSGEAWLCSQLGRGSAPVEGSQYTPSEQKKQLQKQSGTCIIEPCGNGDHSIAQ